MYKVGHKTSPTKFKTEIMQTIFSHHNEMKLEIKSKRKIGRSTNTRTKQLTLKQPMGQRRNHKGN